MHAENLEARARAGRDCSGYRGCGGAALSLAAHHHDRAVSAGRADRHTGAHLCGTLAHLARATRGHRKCRRRRRQYRRRAGRRVPRPTATPSISATSPHTCSAPSCFKLQYDVLTDLEPIALMTTSPMWLLAGTNLPAKNLKELIAWLKANEAKANLAVVGPGSPAHLCGVYFQNSTGTKFPVRALQRRGPRYARRDGRAGRADLP